MTASERKLRILLSEGSSTSARQAITALGLNGHAIEICDPDWRCFGRFSLFVGKFHLCPGLRDHPHAYLDFILTLITREKFDVLLPIHEQGFLFARAQEEIARHVGIALPSLASYELAHSKIGFSRLLETLGMPQPQTRIVASSAELKSIDRFPCVVKRPVGTASRGTWTLHKPEDIQSVLRALEELSAASRPLLVQDFVEGPVEHAQAVYCRGTLVGMHAFRRLREGKGGGAALKESVKRPDVRDHLERIGQKLAWHGALSVDYVLPEKDPTPHYFDCNPRLVEPMNAVWSGLDLAELLVEVSLGQAPRPAPESRAGTRTHSAMQALLGCAVQTHSRRALIAEILNLRAGRGPYAGSREDLTPTTIDWISIIPLTVTALILLINPRLAHRLAESGWGSHLLSEKTIRNIKDGLPINAAAGGHFGSTLPRARQ